MRKSAARLPLVSITAAFIAGVLVAQLATLTGVGPIDRPTQTVAVTLSTTTTAPAPPAVIIEAASTTTTTAAAPTTTTTRAPKPKAKAKAAASKTSPMVTTPGPLPTGLGMWIWMPERAEGGNVQQIVAKAKRIGLSHIYVRTGSSWQGFHGAAFLDRILPIAHKNGLRVYGWDFPNLQSVDRDVKRAMVAIRHTTARGHRLDGFVPDLETPSEGTHISAAKVAQYMKRIRVATSETYPLIACVPRPSDYLRRTGWPFRSAIKYASAVAPMVYWFNRQPDTDVAGTIELLREYGKPIIPIGQAWDASAEGGRPGPTAGEYKRFIGTAKKAGAKGVSFWSWQHASLTGWRTIRDTTVYDGRRAKGLSEADVKKLQMSLREVGHAVTPTGRWDPPTIEAIAAFQMRKKLEPTGLLDGRTRKALRGEGVTLPA